MKRGDLTVEDLHKLLIYNHESGELFWKERTPDMFVGPHVDKHCKCWNGKLSGKRAFSVTAKGYRAGHLMGMRVYEHRVAWAMHFGEWPKETIDHINGNPADNRIKNLRSVTHAENMKNVKLRSDNKSGVVGVFWETRAGKWCARIEVNGSVKSLGYYDDKEEAAKARMKAEIKYGFHENHGKK